MHRLSYVFLSVLLLVSCSREDLSSSMSPQLEITLSCVSDRDTKAGDEDIYAQEGVDVLLHENLLSTVDLFFYPGNDVTSDAVYHVFKDYGKSGKIKSDILRLSLDSEIINNLIFPSHNNVTQCYVFAVVNYPGQLVEQNAQGEDILTGTSLEQLQSIAVTTDFITPGTGENSHYHANFMMSGSSVMSLRGRNQILAGSATIELQRYACKMTVGVKVAPQVLKDSEVWEPMLESMEIYLVDGVKTVCLSGEMPQDPSASYFSFRNNSMRFIDMDTGDPYFEKDGDYLQTYPFYMYPQRWIYGHTESPNKEPYLKLVLPWKRVVGGYTQKQYYYKVFIPDDYREENICRFVRNNWYHINIDVGILGSETDEDKVSPDVTFYVVDWQDKNVVIKNADIGKARYLSVERDTTIIYNEPQARLPYVSSHPVTMLEDSIRVGRIYYGTKKSGGDLGGTITTAGKNDIFPEGTVYLNFSKAQREDKNEGKDWFEDKESAIEFTHSLNNNYKDPVFDYSYYVIRFVLVHADHPESKEYRKGKPPQALSDGMLCRILQP